MLDWAKGSNLSYNGYLGIKTKDVRYGLISKFDIFRFDIGSYSIIRFDSIRYFHLKRRKVGGGHGKILKRSFELQSRGAHYCEAMG